MKAYADKTPPSTGARPSMPPVPSSAVPEPRRDAPNADELRALLTRHRGNVAAVGREFGKERMQVHRWLRKYDINPDDFR